MLVGMGGASDTRRIHLQGRMGGMDAQDNVYAAPRAPLVAAPTERPRLPPFYVVSVTKLALLSFATMGLYTLYWFWRHWKLHAIDSQRDIMPVPRAIFSIFFAHGLNREIDPRLRRRGSRHAWSPGGWATLYVFSAIGGRLLGSAPDSVLAPAPGFGLIMLTVAGCTLAMTHAQRAANLASDDPGGAANARLTAANWFWLVLGGLFWLASLAGMALLLGDA